MTTKIRILESTGNQEEDAKLLAQLKGSLVNATSFEEAKERERAANKATGSEEPSRNALTDEPRLKGQVLTVLVEEDEDNDGVDKKATKLHPETEFKQGQFKTAEIKVEKEPVTAITE